MAKKTAQAKPKKACNSDTLTGKKKKVWTLFSKFIRLRDSLRTTGTLYRCKCITCGREYDTKKMQAGHFLPGRIDAVLFDEKGVNAQCYRCNMLLQGVWPAYYRAMQGMHGQDWIENSIGDWERNERSYDDPQLIILQRIYSARIERLLLKGK